MEVGGELGGRAAGFDILSPTPQKMGMLKVWSLGGEYEAIQG